MRQAERVKVHRDLMLAHAEETTDTNHHGGDLPIPIKYDLVDLADRFLRVVLNGRPNQLAGADLVALMAVPLRLRIGARRGLHLGIRAWGRLHLSVGAWRRLNLSDRCA